MAEAIKLKYPITVDEKEYFELTFGRLKLKHIKTLPTNFADKWSNGEIEFSSLIPLLASLANVPESVIDEIDIEDIDVVVKGIEDFFGNSLDKIGKN